MFWLIVFLFSSRRRHTRCALVTGVQTCALPISLLSCQPTDPSMNTVAGGSIANMMGAPGAWIADFLLCLFGVPGALVLPLMLVLSRRMRGEYAMGGWQGQLGRCLLGIYLIGLALSLYQPDPLVDLDRKSTRLNS